MRSFSVLSLCLIQLLLFGACSSTSSSGASTQDSGAPSTVPPDVGKSCSAGCNADLCIVTSYPNCASGDCLVDARGGLTNIDAYCTGDCTAAACPTGFACEPVPSALTGQPLKRCVKTGAAPDSGAADAPVTSDAGDAGNAGEAGDGGSVCQGTPTDPCDQCLSTNCCAQEQACANSPDCVAYLQCANGCASGDQTCLDNCTSQHPSGEQVFASVVPCLQANCTSQCGGGSGGISSCFSTTAYSSCDAYCSSIHLSCATNCSGANGGFAPRQAGFGYYSDADCQSEVSSGTLIVGCSQTFDPSGSPSARCCCM